MPERTFGGPYVQVAAICQTSIVDNQGLLSLIRLQDRIQIMGMTDELKPQPLFNYQLVLCLKAGEMRGKSTLRLTPIAPSGKQLQYAETPVLFEGDERGAVIQAPLGIIAEEEGLYWLDVTLDGTLLTRVPFRVMYQKMLVPPGMPFPPPSIG
jgi:hypothetical protein